MTADEMGGAIVSFQQSKTFKCSKQGVINMPVGMVSEYTA